MIVSISVKQQQKKLINNEKNNNNYTYDFFVF